MKDFKRVTIKVKGGTYTFWSENDSEQKVSETDGKEVKVRMFKSCDGYGKSDWDSIKAGNGGHAQMVTSSPEDVISEKSAKLDLTYGELVVEGENP